MTRISASLIAVLLVVSSFAGGIASADMVRPQPEAATATADGQIGTNLDSNFTRLSASNAETNMTDVGVGSAQLLSLGQSVSISPDDDESQPEFVKGGVYTALVNVDVSEDGLIDTSVVESPALQLSLDSSSSDGGAAIVGVASSESGYDQIPDNIEDTCQTGCTVTSSTAFAAGSRQTVLVRFRIDDTISPDSVTLSATPGTADGDSINLQTEKRTEVTYSIIDSVSSSESMANAAEARKVLASGYNETHDRLFYYEDWDDRFEQDMARAFTVVGNDAAASLTGSSIRKKASKAYELNTNKFGGDTTVGKISRINHRLILNLMDRMAVDRVDSEGNTSYPLRELARLSQAEADAWRAGNREEVRENLSKKKYVLYGYADGVSSGYELEYEEAIELPRGAHPNPGLITQAKHQQEIAEQEGNKELVEYFDAVQAFAKSEHEYIRGTAMPMARMPDPHVTLDSSRAELRARLEAADEGQLVSAQFTVSNGDTAGVTSAQGYLSVSHADELDLVSFEQVDGDERVAVTNISADGEDINYKNGSQDPATHPLTDVREQFDPGETNTYELTFRKETSDAVNAWIAYRAAFEPLMHDNDPNTDSFARYPSDNAVSSTDQQNFAAFNVSGGDESVEDLPPEARISASQTTVTAGDSITFSSSQSSDDTRIDSRTWELAGTTKTGEEISHQFNPGDLSEPMQRDVSLTVEDTNGQTDTTTLTVTVLPAPELTASFEANRTVIEPGLPTTLRATTDATTYAWDRDGDGSYDDATGREITWTPSTAGEHTLGLQVSTGNQQDSVSLSYSVESAEQQLTEPTPVLDIPSHLEVGESGTFDASESTDKTVSSGELTKGNISDYEWDFTNDGTLDSTQAIASHSYEFTGEYTVKLKLTDDSGNSVSVTNPVTVTAEEDNDSVTTAPTCSEVEYTGSGTSADPYKIGNISQLQCIESQGLESHYILISDIDASGTKEWNDGTGFTPISINFEHTQFSGSFDGNHHTIRNMTIDRPNSSNIGLFSHFDHSGLIENVHLDNVNIRGANEVGSIVGFAMMGTVKNSSADGNITATGTSVKAGGLVGWNNGAVINSSATVDVHNPTKTRGTDWDTGVGGIIGYNTGTVQASSASGKVSGYEYVGGLVGNNGKDKYTDVDATISTSSASGEITGSHRVGGLVGENHGLISESFSNNRVVADSGGGLIGRNAGVVEKSYVSGTIVDSTGYEYVGTFARDNTGAITRSFAVTDVNRSSYTGSTWYQISFVDSSNGKVNASYWDTSSFFGNEYYIRVDSNVTELRNVDITGNAARNNMSELDFSETWQIRTGDHPVLAWQTIDNETSNIVPIARFTYEPSAPSTNETVTFDAADSRDTDGTISSYTWDVDNDDTAEMTGESVTHTYSSPGNYTVVLTVVDENGTTNSTTETVTVTESGPTDPPAIVGDNRPSDTDGDGAFEDVNGDNVFDVNDVTALWANRNSDAVTNNPQAFDINSDSSFDVNDVTALWNDYLNG